MYKIACIFKENMLYLIMVVFRMSAAADIG